MEILGLILSGVLSAGASIFGANAQQQGQDKALAAQTDATNKQIALAKDIFGKQQENEQPWMDAGKQALATLTQRVNDGSFDLSKYGYADLVQDPGYKFRLEQGTNALERTAAARGKLLSGNEQQAISDYAQQSASQEFGNAFARTGGERDATVGRLQNLVTVGQNAAAGTGSNLTTLGSTVNAALGNQGNAAATAAQNSGNIVAGAANDVATSGNQALENYMLYNRLAA